MCRLLNSPLFPYTTLFRSPLRWPRLVLFFMPKPGGSSLDVSLCKRKDILAGEQREISSLKRGQSPVRSVPFSRSEEHTSELQSLTNLVCRLLLEKKKNTTS